MPATINGIGTHYYGRGNASARRDTCEFCGRLAVLTSYDTREFFCVIFIPLIPIAKYRIFDECSSCRKHRRIKFAEFQQQVETQVAPLRESVRRSPKDADAHRALIHELAGLRMNADAEEAARAAVDALPTDPGLNLLAGQVLASKGDLDGAAAFLERAVHFDGTDPASRLSLGRVLFLKQNYEGAVRQLEEAHRLAPSDHVATYLLADSYSSLQRWQNALPLWQQIPNPDKAVLRRIAECKKKLGYQLHDAERRAARRWWPFGGRGKVRPVRPATSAASAKRTGIAVAVVLAIVLIGGGVTAWYNTRHVAVWFDSSLPRPTFVVDGNRFSSDTAPPWKRSIAPGKHQVAVLDRSGKTIETRTIEVVAPELIDAVFAKHAYVYNAGAQHVYRRASIDYTVNANDAKYNMKLLGNQAFFAVDGVDYMFVEPPKTVEMSSGTSRVTKTAFSVERDFSLYDYGLYLLQGEKNKDAETAFRTAAQFDKCDSESRRMWSLLRINDGASDEGVKIARDGIEACPGSLIEVHRVYQDALRNAGKLDEAIGIYRGHLAAHPDSAAHHYLLGRIVPSAGESIAEEREALRLDPNLAWAHGALGYSLLGTGAYDEAMAEIGAAVRNGMNDDRATMHYVWSAIAAGRPGDARPLVEKITKERPYWGPRWLLALAEKKWTAAKSLYDERKRHDPRSVATWFFAAQLYQLQGDRAAYERHIFSATKDSDIKVAATIAQIEDSLDRGKWRDAVTAIDSAGERLGDSRDLYALYAAAASMLDGDMAGAANRIEALKKAIESNENLADTDRATLAAELAALAGHARPESTIEALHDDVLQMKHAWFFLGARAVASGDTARAKQYFANSARASFDLNFPLLAAQRLSNS